MPLIFREQLLRGKLKFRFSILPAQWVSTPNPWAVYIGCPEFRFRFPFFLQKLTQHSHEWGSYFDSQQHSRKKAYVARPLVPPVFPRVPQEGGLVQGWQSVCWRWCGFTKIPSQAPKISIFQDAPSCFKISKIAKNDFSRRTTILQDLKDSDIWSSKMC